MDDLVVGDIVHLSAGDMIPADVRILDAKDLFISQASLTGESEPVEKTPKVFPEVQRQWLSARETALCLVPWHLRLQVKQWRQALPKA